MAKNKFLSFSPKQPSNEFSCKTKNFQKAFLNGLTFLTNFLFSRRQPSTFLNLAGVGTLARPARPPHPMQSQMLQLGVL